MYKLLIHIKRIFKYNTLTVFDNDNKFFSNYVLSIWKCLIINFLSYPKFNRRSDFLLNWIIFSSLFKECLSLCGFVSEFSYCHRQNFFCGGGAGGGGIKKNYVLIFLEIAYSDVKKLP